MFDFLKSLIDPLRGVRNEIHAARKESEQILWMTLINRMDWPDDAARAKALQSFDPNKHDLVITTLPDSRTKIEIVKAKP